LCQYHYDDYHNHIDNYHDDIDDDLDHNEYDNSGAGFVPSTRGRQREGR